MAKAERMLTHCETVIMKAIWDYGKDIPMLTLIDKLNTEYGCEYARTTVATFLLKLSDKGFIESYKVGRTSLIRATKEEGDYKKSLLSDHVNFWYKGKVDDMVAALCTSEKMEEEEVTKMRKMLDALRQ